MFEYLLGLLGEYVNLLEEFSDTSIFIGFCEIISAYAEESNDIGTSGDINNGGELSTSLEGNY
jgi:hypothetical protein